jgi:hypothetical protein
MIVLFVILSVEHLLSIFCARQTCTLPMYDSIARMMLHAVWGGACLVARRSCLVHVEVEEVCALQCSTGLCCVRSNMLQLTCSWVVSVVQQVLVSCL